jgi:transaldolase
MIKVPGTEEGLPAIRRLISEGINVNVTLLFSLQRYEEVVNAFLIGLEDRQACGLPIDHLTSVASFFLSRIDTKVDAQLDKIIQAGGSQAELARELKGQTAIASAKVAYQIYKRIIANARWQKLAAQGARPQRLLWASTSTKNPEYNDVKYVEPLIGPDTINTLPPETLDAYRDHGQPANRLEENAEDSRRHLEQLRNVNIDLDEITRQLVEEGIEKFQQPFDKLIATIEVKSKQSGGIITR